MPPPTSRTSMDTVTVASAAGIPSSSSVTVSPRPRLPRYFSPFGDEAMETFDAVKNRRAAPMASHHRQAYERVERLDVLRHRCVGQLSLVEVVELILGRASNVRVEARRAAFVEGVVETTPDAVARLANAVCASACRSHSLRSLRRVVQALGKLEQVTQVRRHDSLVCRRGRWRWRGSLCAAHARREVQRAVDASISDVAGAGTIRLLGPSS